MEGRCVVETWAQFGCRSSTRTAKVLSMGTDVLLCACSDEVHVFNKQEKKLTSSLLFPCHLTDVILCPDKHSLYAVCDSGVYCVNLSSILSRVPSSSGSQSSSLAVFEISSDWLAVKDKTVCSLLVVGTILLTLSKRDSAWVFALYKIPSSIQSTATGHEKVTELSLSVVSDGSHDNMELNQGTWRGRRPVLTCVYSSDNSPQSANSSSPLLPSSLPSNGHCLLQPIIFKLLFGVDVALSKSPMILCGLPDGRLCSFPLRLPGSRVRILHSLEQPVVLIGTSTVPSDMETGTEGPRCLVVVGGEGRVLLVSTCEEGAEAGGKVAGFTEGFVSGPVECGYVDEDRLYYSTGSDLLSLDLPAGASERAGPGGSNALSHRERQSLGHGEEVPSKTVAFQRPASLNVYGITTLTGPSQRNPGAVQLVGLSSRGRLQGITLPKRRDDRGLPSLPSSQVGQRIRDLLAAIGDVCDRASVLKRTIQDKNDILRQLNQVLNISCLMLADHSSDAQIPVQEKPIRCHAVSRWNRLLQQDSLHLTCVLENSSCYVLEHGWSFCVTVIPLSHSPAVATKNTSRTFMFPFSSLHPGEKFEVSLPLAAADDVTFPMTVCCTLIFSLKGLVGEDVLSSLLPARGHAVAGPRPGLDSSCVSLALETLTVDWLDALQLGVISTDTVAMDTIQGFISTRRGGGTGRLVGGPELYSACIRVSSELLSSTVVLEDTLEVDPKRPTLAPTHLCASMLRWLLSQSPGRGEMEFCADMSGQGNSVVHARGPGGHMVKLTAKEITIGLDMVEKEKAEMPLRAVEVQIESSSMAAVCGLHHALLRRLQTLLQRAPEEAVSTGVERLGLRQALRRAEAMLQQLQQCRTPEAFGVVSSGGQMTQSLLSVYRQLRENPLLII